MKLVNICLFIGSKIRVYTNVLYIRTNNGVVIDRGYVLRSHKHLQTSADSFNKTPHCSKIPKGSLNNQ